MSLLRRSLPCVLVATTALVLAAAVPGVVSAGLGLPKVSAPKLPSPAEKGDDTSEIKPSKPGTPELVSINPESVPPGTIGEISVSGTGFDRISGATENGKRTLAIQLTCEQPGLETSVRAGTFYIEGDKARGSIRVPPMLPEGRCKLAATGTNNVPVTQHIPKSAPSLPVTADLVVVAEAKLTLEEAATKMSEIAQAMMGTGKIRNAHLSASRAGLKVVEGERTLIDRPVAEVKSVESFQFLPQMLLVELADGKGFTFTFGPGPVLDALSEWQQTPGQTVSRALGK